MQTNPDSSLSILSQISLAKYDNNPSHKALYGLLLFEALDKNNKPLKPDSVIAFSLKYYVEKDDKPHLLLAYFYNARMRKLAQQFDDATVLYLKALDLATNSCENYFLLGKIYSDMGDICLIQMDYRGALNKFLKSIDYFNKSENWTEANLKVISIGKVFHFQNKYRMAHHYYRQAIAQTSDSLVSGFGFQEMGINYYWAKQYDSAQYFLKKSLKYPFKGTNYAIRCVNLADLYFDIQQYDSAIHYANLALKYPASFFNQRDCYRILANTEYVLKDFQQMASYMTRYQACTDSVRKLESQTKFTVLEGLHKSAKTVDDTTRKMVWSILFFALALLSVLFIAINLYTRSQNRKVLLNAYKQELTNKQTFVSQTVCRKITEMREQQAEHRKTASPAERERLDRELYEKCLHLSNWEAFSCEMNHAFNNIVETLVQVCPRITRKEIIWCCLHLLNVPNQDRVLILDATTDSLYKLRQRLAQKMNLDSTRDLDSYLRQLSEVHG